MSTYSLGLSEHYRTDAALSACGMYRWWLGREWGDPTKRVCFLMLNPSTADAFKDDKTITACVAFARDWNFGALDVVNLFAYRSRHPEALLAATDPVGTENNEWIARTIDKCDRLVRAWGSHKKIRALVDTRVPHVESLLWHRRCEIGALGYCEDGNPRHPLFLRRSTPFIEESTLFDQAR